MDDLSAGEPGGGPAGPDHEAATALARAAVRAIIKLSPDAAALVRAELRKEAVGLEVKGGDRGKAAAAAVRRLMEETGQ